MADLGAVAKSVSVESSGGGLVTPTVAALGSVASAGFLTETTGYSAPSISTLGLVNLLLIGAHKTPLLGPVETVYIPATLPRPTYSGYQLAPVDQTVRTDLEVGTPRQRRRTQARNDQVSVSWRLSESEMADFRSWFDGSSEANGGAAWFNGLELATGDGVIRTVEARFVGPWTATLSPGQIWDVSAKLEVRA